jgi:hypothetical protein
LVLVDFDVEYGIWVWDRWINYGIVEWINYNGIFEWIFMVCLI